MFDISFWEIVIVALIGLVIIGPKRLPMVAHTIGGWIRNIKQLFNNVKSEVDHQVKMDHLKQNQEKARQAEQRNND